MDCWLCIEGDGSGFSHGEVCGGASSPGVWGIGMGISVTVPGKLSGTAWTPTGISGVPRGCSSKSTVVNLSAVFRDTASSGGSGMLGSSHGLLVGTFGSNRPPSVGFRDTTSLARSSGMLASRCCELTIVLCIGGGAGVVCWT